MQFDGVIASWNDARGFGFIEPLQGGDPVFVHIKAFQGGAPRPHAGQRVRFAVEAGPGGRKRACRVEPLPPAARASAARAPATAPRPARPRGRQEAHGGSAQWGTASLLVLPAYAVFCMVLAAVGTMPRWIPVACLGLSAWTYFMYWRDKRAAEQGAWRTSEKTLHLLALAGGWPGALLAQQVLRHKSAKRSFRTVFWATVALHAAALGWLCSPHGDGLRAALPA